MKPHRAWLVALTITGVGVVPALRAQDAPAPAAPRHDPEQLRERLERLRERAAALASSLPSASAAPAPLPSAFELPMSPAELAKRWAAHAATRHERQVRHRAQLLSELGGQLDNPAAVAELKLHARRVAELGRIEFLAQNARQGASRTQLLARVAKLRARELARHQKRLVTLTGRASPGLSASAAVPGASARREAPP